MRKSRELTFDAGIHQPMGKKQVRRMNRTITAYLSVILSIILAPLRLLPIRSGRLVFISFGGGGQNEYACNPKYICETILAQTARQSAPIAANARRTGGKPLEIIWIVADPARYADLRSRGIILARHQTLPAIIYLLTARVVISNGAYLAWFPFRKAQYVINTWHGGGAYKKLASDLPGAGWTERRKTRVSARNTDLFLSGSKAFTAHVIRGAFRFQGEVLEAGLPRNDLLLGADRQRITDQVRQLLDLDPAYSVVLYAPTFRDTSQPIPEPLDPDRLLAALTARFGGQWLLLYRAHKLDRGTLGTPLATASVRDVSAYPDMQELLCLADVLVTDYSSSIWDFALTRRPCWLYVPDLPRYQAGRGFYVDLPEWQIPYARDNDALASLISQSGPEQAHLAASRHLERLQNTETGQAAAAVAQVILRQCNL